MTTQIIVAELDATSRAYTSLMKAAVRLQLQIKAHRRSIKTWQELEYEAMVDLFTQGVTPHLHEALAVIVRPKRQYERTISTLAQQLPVWPWVKRIRGLGPLGLGLIIGQTGDLSGYDTHSRLWKRMGLAVGSDGRAQRRQRGLSGELAGFSPVRRALMHVIGDALMKQNKIHGDGPQNNWPDGVYRHLYLARKVYEAAKAPTDVPMVHHQRSLRYMEKKFLRDLWHAWRAVGQLPTPA